ncbi:hypothetical protein TSUD_238850 [Trifolium subterraneum]|uniref:Rx N-terminal domain-containing protein n=1 Tax=Trifolium subterraneum TaxID=3900 RepID=A0A2Z6P0C1_TRISU|nr:hypothetical protein TSUD_238850 [Trifolium subterraneum]
MEGLHEALQHMTALQSLTLSNLPNLASLPDWLGNLGLLQNLEIFQCPKLMCLPLSIQRLTGLKSLRIYRCNELGERCKENTALLKRVSLKSAAAKGYLTDKEYHEPPFHFLSSLRNMVPLGLSLMERPEQEKAENLQIEELKITMGPLYSTKFQHHISSIDQLVKPVDSEMM